MRKRMCFSKCAHFPIASYENSNVRLAFVRLAIVHLFLTTRKQKEEDQQRENTGNSAATAESSEGLIIHHMQAEATMNDSNLEQSISYWEYNAEYEREGQRETVWAGDGHCVDQSWLLGDGVQGDEIAVTNDRPTLLYTCIRYPSGPEAGKSIAHENHPFVALVHLLAAAEPNSEVFLSAHSYRTLL